MVATPEVYLAAIPRMSSAWKAMVLWLAIAVGPASAGPRHDRRVAEREAQAEQSAALEAAARREAIAYLEDLIAKTDDGTLPALEPLVPSPPIVPTEAELASAR
jgi:hypothetical protein